MEINEFIGIAIVGTGLSILIDLIKAKFGTDATKTKLLTVVLAVVLGTAYHFASHTVYWQSVLSILGVASTFYAFFLRKPSN